MAYQIADGHNNAGGLVDITPQPACEGVRYPVHVMGGDGTPKNKGAAFAIFRYSGELNESSDQFTSLLTQFGLSSALFNDVTVSIINEDRATFTNYNGRIIKPFNTEYKKAYYRDIEFVIINLEAI